MDIQTFVLPIKYYYIFCWNFRIRKYRFFFSRSNFIGCFNIVCNSFCFFLHQILPSLDRTHNINIKHSIDSFLYRNKPPQSPQARSSRYILFRVVGARFSNFFNYFEGRHPPASSSFFS